MWVLANYRFQELIVRISADPVLALIQSFLKAILVIRVSSAEFREQQAISFFRHWHQSVTLATFKLLFGADLSD